MNKLFTKTTSLALGAAMMIGVGVSVGSKSKATVANAASPATLTFTAKCGGSGTDSDGNTWTVTSDASESAFDNTKGIHYGTGSVAVSYVKLTTSGISGTISQIKVNASGASKTSAKLNVTVGGSAFGSQQSLTATATEYTLTGSGSGQIIVEITQSRTKKALYCKSISVTYAGGETPTISSVSVTGGPSSTVSGVVAGTPGPTLTATATFATGSGTPSWTWSSNNESAVKVNSSGKLLYVGNGNATISAQANYPAASGGTNIGSTSVTTANLKGLSSSDPISVDEALTLMDAVGSGNVGQAEIYVNGTFDEGTTYDSSHSQWVGYFSGTGSNKILVKATNDSSVDIGTTDGAADNKECIVKGYVELYNGTYQLSYLPASVSPTGSAYTPSIVEIKLNLVTAQEVIDLISAIGTVTYTDACKEKIDAARAKANDYLLQEGCKEADITNYSTLTAAESAYEALADQAAVDAAEALVDALPAASSITDYSHHSDIVAARAAYTDLTDDQKDLYNAEKLQKLVDCEAADAQFEPTSLTIHHNQTTSGNMSGDNDAASYFADENDDSIDDSIWSIVGIKNDPGQNVGLNQDGTIRLYAKSDTGNGSTLQISTLDAAYTITTVSFTFGNTVGSYAVTTGGTSVTPVNDEYEINSSEFSIQNITTGGTTQVHIRSITIFYSVSQSASADDFIDAVDAIPDVADINASNLETVNGLIATADSEYAKLTPELKEDSTVIAKKAVLDAAKEKAVDVGYEVEAAPVITAIDALPAASSITDYSHHSDIVAARSLYENLSTEVKAKVSNLAKLEACEAKDAEYAPLAVSIDTDGGQDHSGDSDAPSTAFADADELSTAYPTNSSLIEWTDCTTTYGSDSSVLKLGSSKNTGSVKLSFTHDRLYAPSVTLDAKAWSDKTVTVSINGVEQSFSGVNHSLTFDLSSVEFTGDVVITTTSSERRISIYGIDVAYAYRADYQGALTFEENFIKKNIAYPETTPTGVPGTACLPTSEEGGLGYFDAAVAEYNDNVSAASKIEFANHTDFAKARERFVAWGLANRKTVTFDATTGAITVTPIGMSLINNMFATSESTATTVIIIISVIGVSALGGFFFLRKRKEI